MGGHHEYFSRHAGPNLEEAPAALRTIGATEQASILVEAYGAVAAASSHAPEQYSNRYLAGVEFADLVRFDDAFHRCTSPVAVYLMSYLDKHESEFIEWPP